MSIAVGVRVFGGPLFAVLTMLEIVRIHEQAATLAAGGAALDNLNDSRSNAWQAVLACMSAVALFAIWVHSAFALVLWCTYFAVYFCASRLNRSLMDCFVSMQLLAICLVDWSQQRPGGQMQDFILRIDNAIASIRLPAFMRHPLVLRLRALLGLPEFLRRPQFAWPVGQMIGHHPPLPGAIPAVHDIMIDGVEVEYDAGNAAQLTVFDDGTHNHPLAHQGPRMRGVINTAPIIHVARPEEPLVAVATTFANSGAATGARGPWCGSVAVHLYLDRLAVRDLASGDILFEQRHSIGLAARIAECHGGSPCARDAYLTRTRTLFVFGYTTAIAIDLDRSRYTAFDLKRFGTHVIAAWPLDETRIMALCGSPTVTRLITVTQDQARAVGSFNDTHMIRCAYGVGGTGSGTCRAVLWPRFCNDYVRLLRPAVDDEKLEGDYVLERGPLVNTGAEKEHTLIVCDGWFVNGCKTPELVFASHWTGLFPPKQKAAAAGESKRDPLASPEQRPAGKWVAEPWDDVRPCLPAGVALRLSKHNMANVSMLRDLCVVQPLERASIKCLRPSIAVGSATWTRAWQTRETYAAHRWQHDDPQKVVKWSRLVADATADRELAELLRELQCFLDVLRPVYSHICDFLIVHGPPPSRPTQ